MSFGGSFGGTTFGGGTVGGNTGFPTLPHSTIGIPRQVDTLLGSNALIGIAKQADTFLSPKVSVPRNG